MVPDLSPEVSVRAGTARLYYAWAALVSATVVVSLLRNVAPFSGAISTKIQLVVAVIAFAKIYLVLDVFMGVGSSPSALKALSIAWVVLVCCGVCFFLAGLS